MRWWLALVFLARFAFAAGTAADVARAIRENSFDRDECYRVRDLTFAKEDIRLYLNDGHLIFSKPVAGRRIAAVFAADVDLEATPDALSKFLPTPSAVAAGVRAVSGTVFALSDRKMIEAANAHRTESTHYSYEDEDQSAAWNPARVKPKTQTPLRNYNSIDNIAEFFASRGKRFSVPKLLPEEPTGRHGFRPGQKVKHPKYGEGTVYQREGDGEDAKITVQFPRFGLKKLVERYAQLEKA